MGMGGKKMIHLYDPIGPSSAHDIFHFFFNENDDDDSNSNI